ncbi:zinc-binding dehydrogenase [Noviherbaspirillum sp. L7-7A]|uniref:quinone oxidoreductase family protein n=1 Tax=Noviherbaspirillum sp. L7-7A TaxID=2850560 RepID=UPI002011D3FE|nr:zinc-binding dehydrogenase [Noviherbaspirillum sp. L7-7A]
MDMQSWWMDTAPAEPRIEMRSVPVPEPGPGQLLLKVHAASLNRGEFIIGHGLTKAGSAKAIGLDGAGVVARAGPGASRFAPGQRVMGRFNGALSQYALINEAEAMPVPGGLSWAEAAGTPITYMVAHDMLMTQGRLAAGKWLLIAGVTSGVGTAALQLAHALGARVIGTSGSQAKLDALAAHGLDIGLCTRGPDFHDAVMQATGGAGVNLVINSVGGSVFAECLRCMAFEGRLATVGYVDGVLHADIDLQALHARRLVLFGVSNKQLGSAGRAAAAQRFRQDVLPMLADGRVRPLIGEVYPFDRLAEARAAMESNAHLGKIVIAVEQLNEQSGERSN